MVNPDLIGEGIQSNDPRVQGYILDSEKRDNRKQVMNLAGLQSNKNDYVSG